MHETAATPGLLRIFAGVKIDLMPALRDVLRALGMIGKAVRPTREDQLHVTLKFFGDTAEDLIPQLAQDLADAITGTGPFDWTLRGTGAFPSAARPSVVWAGADDAGRFATLADRIEAVGETHGFAREARRFHPHVTLARIKFRPPPALADLLRETAERDFGPQRTTELVLYRSELGPGGSVYTPLHVVKL